MVASLLRVLTRGIQDERLYFKPTIYPFMKVYRPAGRFTTQWIRIDFDNVPDFGSTGFFRIQRKGHLVTRLYLVSTMPDIWTPQAAARAAAVGGSGEFIGPSFGWTNSLGHALVQNASLSIAGDVVERIDSRLLEVMDEYSTPLEKETVVNRLISRKDNGFNSSSFGHGVLPHVTVVPLPFWFTRGDTGCALPIDAIAYDEVRVGIQFRDVNGLYYTEARNVAGEVAALGGGGGSGSATSAPQGSALWGMANSVFYQRSDSGSPVPGLTDLSAAVIPGITMPGRFSLGETYVLAEYVYLDQPEANRFRLADLQMSIVQHYSVKPTDTNGLNRVRIPFNVPNPARDLFWMVQRVEATAYNAHFLATRDLSGYDTIVGYDISAAPWWPNATGLSALYAGPLRPAFALSDSEPVSSVALVYEGNLVRFGTTTPSLFRSVLPSLEQKKSPWVNRYYYNFSFGVENGLNPFSRSCGEANLDKMKRIELQMDFNPMAGSYDPNNVPRYVVYVWAETYNILRVYGGRAGMLFAY